MRYTTDNICIDSIDAWHRCFCDAPASMYTIRNGFTQLLRYCFSDAEHYDIYKDALACMVYKGDGTGLKVYAEGASDPNDTNNVPAVVLSLGEGIAYDMPTISDVVDDDPSHAVFRTHSIGTVLVTVNCKSRSADEACMLSDLVAMFITAVKVRVMTSWGGWLRDYRLVRQTEPTLKQTGSESSVVWYESSVAFRLSFGYNVRTVQESKRLKGSSIYGGAGGNFLRQHQQK